MEISLNASSPPVGSVGQHAPIFRPIVYLATSPPTSQQLEDGACDTSGTGLLLARAGGSLTGVHSVSRPINIPVRRATRESPVSGMVSWRRWGDCSGRDSNQDLVIAASPR